MIAVKLLERGFMAASFLLVGFILYICMNVMIKYGSPRSTTLWDSKPLSRTTKNQTVSKCSSHILDELINMPISPKLYDNLDVGIFERSGCFLINSNKSGLYRIVHKGNFPRVICNATKRMFLPTTVKEQRTGLVSLPGSGNTWVRHLLEELTGIYTGSMYNDIHFKNVFLGEGRERNVIGIKTHEPFQTVGGSFSRAILIVRDPFEASLANYNRCKLHSHTGTLDQENFDKNELMGYLNELLKDTGSSFNADWLNGFKGDILVLFYEKLQTDLLNSLIKMAAFTKSEVTLIKLWCILQNREGVFHRKQQPDWMSRKKLLNKTVEKSILDWKQVLQTALKKRASSLATN